MISAGSDQSLFSLGRWLFSICTWTIQEFAIYTNRPQRIASLLKWAANVSTNKSTSMTPFSRKKVHPSGHGFTVVRMAEIVVDATAGQEYDVYGISGTHTSYIIECSVHLK